MLLRDTSNWTDLDNMKGLLFLVQRLEELTFPYSLDSYKSPTMSVQGLLQEALSLIRRDRDIGDQHLEKVKNSLSHIVDELKFRLKGHFIAKFISTLDLDELIAPCRDDEKLSDVERRFKVAAAELNNQEYFHEIVSSIISFSENGKQKNKLEFLAREFVSFLQYRGVSREYIQKVIIDFFWGSQEINSVTQFKEFCKAVYPHEHKFFVVFGVNKNLAAIDDRTLSRVRATILENPIDKEWDERISEGFCQAVEEFRAQVEYPDLCMIVTSATDFNSAVLKSSKSLEEIYNFFRVFSHKTELELYPKALVEQSCCSGERTVVQSSSNTMHFIRDMRKVKATSVLKRFSENITLDVGPDRHKFKNAVNIHGMSLNVASADIQLVNMWTCLETLAPSERSSSKIANVVNSISPILMLGYLNRLTSNVLFDVIRWDRRKLTEAISLINDSAEGDLKSKFIRLLSREENEKARNFLLSECAYFELLRNRLANISEILSDRKKAHAKISSHKILVEWQIHRIYRTRNSIVHSGGSPEYTGYLVENAHDFFDQTLLFCLELSGWKPGFNTFASCFDYAEAQYRSYLATLKSAGEGGIVWQLPKYRDMSVVFDSSE